MTHTATVSPTQRRNTIIPDKDRDFDPSSIQFHIEKDGMLVRLTAHDVLQTWNKHVVDPAHPKRLICRAMVGEGIVDIGLMESSEDTVIVTIEEI